MSVDAQQLQAYISERKAQYVTLSKPGYEVYFYSRMDQNAQIIPYLQSTPCHVMDTQAGDKSLIGTTPTLALSSDVSRSGVAVVTNIKIHNTINSQDGSTATIELVQPEGVEYFKPTIGDRKVAHPPDFDYSPNRSNHRIGTMDTVVIRLKNSSMTKTNREVVFRGVISVISRKKSPTGGSLISLQLRDFSHFLRQISAISLGIFSTMSFSLTGRGLCLNLLRYANKIYSGQWLLFGQDTQKWYVNLQSGIANALNNDAGTNSSAVEQYLTGAEGLGTPSQNAEEANQSITHQMFVPPYLHLQFSLNAEPGFVDTDVNPKTYNSFVAPINNTNEQQSNGDNAIQQAFSNVVNYLQQSGNTWLNNNSPMRLTPEDQETIQTYQVSLAKSEPHQLGKNSNQDLGNQIVQNLEHYAWIFSDLYLDVGLLSFEHQRIWQTMWTAATRSMREVYFDFAPKLSATATAPWVSAQVAEIKQAAPQELPDIHPNIGIMKYRLSPCFMGYQEGRNNLDSQFWQYKITDDQIVSQELNETEENVATAVFGYGSNLDNEGIAGDVIKQLTGQSRGLFAYAQTLDPTYETRLGYRIMSDHDMKIRFPILMYLTSYVLLEQSQMSMFWAQVTVNGNPKIQPGSLVYLVSPYIDYYCTEVLHNWSLEDGFTTTLMLGYGHTHGIPPAALTGGVATDSEEAYKQCTLKSAALDPYISESTMVGSVNVHCFVSALWDYMTGCASSTAALKKANSDYEKEMKKPPANVDWIKPNSRWDTNTKESRDGQHFAIPQGYNNPLISTYDSIILDQIQTYGLDKFNVTVTAVKNLIALESTWQADAVASDGGYGWFQLTNKENVISDKDAVYDFTKACNVAMGVLNESMRAACGNNPANATGKAFLAGFVGYNYGSGYASPQNWQFSAGGNNSNPPYVYLVFGQDQANAIANNQQLPDGIGGQNLQQWPYDVYGPIGMQIDGAALASFSNMTSEQLKSKLETWDVGMKLSVQYANYLLKKYSTQNLSGNGPYNSVNQHELFDKAVAAWYANENDLGMDFAKFQSVLSDVKKLYLSCLNCSKNTPPTSNANLDAALQNLRLQNLNFRVPVNNPDITSPFGPRQSPTAGASSYHKGWDMQDAQSRGNSTVYAAETGVVVFAGPAGNFGTAVVIQHKTTGDYVNTVYGDLSSCTVSVGQTVKKGDVIAYAGPNPNSVETGAHLHWQINTNCPEGVGFGSDGYLAGVAQDPAKLGIRA